MRGIIAAAAFLTSGLSLIAADVPRQSPEFAFTVPGGQHELLSKYKGKVVVLEFLFTTCPHCQQSATTLSKLQNEYGPRGLQVLGVAINPDPDIPGFKRMYATAFPVGAATRDQAFVYLQQSIMSPNFYVPQVVFIDRKGVIRAQYGGTDAFLGAQQETNMRGMIEQLLAESGGKPASAKPATSKSKAAKKKVS
jgi:cytochrome oxidase Cu insertion factor (SCO1/SenC/PrrC family)